MRKKITIEEIIALLFGVLGTMPIISIKGLTLFSWMSILTVIIYIIVSIYDKKIIYSKFTNIYLWIVILSLITCLGCLASNIPMKWKNIQITGFIWNLIYLIIMMYYSSSKSNVINGYLKGVYYAAIIHSIWGIMQFVLFKLFGVSLNDLVFVDILKMSVDSVSQFKNGGLAVTGLCSNAGNLAPLLVFGFYYTSSYGLKALFVVCALLSSSRTNLIGIILFIFISFILKEKKRTIKKSTALFFLGAFFMIVGLTFTDFGAELISKIDYLFTNLSSETLKTQSSAVIHIRYLTSVFDVMTFAGIFSTLFGFGLGCSGYPFEYIYGQFSMIDIGAWVVECDPINYLWSTGLISTVLRYVWFFKYVLVSFKMDKFLFALLITLFLEGFMYNITFNWVFIMLICIFINLDKKKGKNNERKIKTFNS